MPFVIALLGSENAEAQYNAARIIRHLAMGDKAEHKFACLKAVVPLVRTLQVRLMFCLTTRSL